MAEIKKVPAIRFKGFSDEWIESPFDEVVDFFSGLTYSPKDVVSNNGTFVLRSSNVKNGEIVNADDVFVNSEVVNCDNVKEGDIAVVVRNGSRSLIGKHAQIKREMKNTVIGAFMTGIRSEQPNFTNALLDTEQFNKEVEKNLGATINQITAGAFKRMSFCFPDADEQTQIGSYFQRLDKLISLHQTKVNKLTNLKKAMLEKMFPKQGADVPEIRFKGFAGAWGMSKLSDITSLITKGTTPLIKAGNKTVNFIKIENIDSQSGEIFVTSKITLDEHEKYLKRSQLQENDILFSIAGTLGRVASVNKSLLPANTNQALAIIRLNKNSISFILTFLRSKALDEFVKKNPTVGAQPNLSLTQIASIDIPLPTIEEQQKIGAYFQNLDKTITLHQTELDKLKNLKKACLEKMFV